jgi:hypothetical protein
MPSIHGVILLDSDQLAYNLLSVISINLKDKLNKGLTLGNFETIDRENGSNLRWGDRRKKKGGEKWGSGGVTVLVIISGPPAHAPGKMAKKFRQGPPTYQ